MEPSKEIPGDDKEDIEQSRRMGEGTEEVLTDIHGNPISLDKPFMTINPETWLGTLGQKRVVEHLERVLKGVGEDDPRWKQWSESQIELLRGQVREAEAYLAQTQRGDRSVEPRKKVN